jgi:hypothetical protein
MRRCGFFLIFVLGVWPPFAQAQQSPTPSPASTANASPQKSDQPQVELMTMSKEGAEMRLLVAALAGTWSVKEQYDDGRVGTGEEIWRAGPGGVPLIEEYHLKSGPGNESTGFAVIWWDREAKQYQGRWCADFNDQGCSSFSVKWEGDRLEFTGVYPDSGRRVFWKEVFYLGPADSFVQTLEMGEEGQALKRLSTIRAKKVGDAAQTSRPGSKP